MPEELDLRPDHVSITMAQWAGGPPGLGEWTGNFVSISTEGPDGLGVTRDAIRRAIDEATLPNDRVLDEHWSEYDWGASGQVGYAFDLILSFGLEEAVRHLVKWFKSRTEPSWATVSTPEEAIQVVRHHVGKLHHLKDFEVTTCERKGDSEWSLVGRSIRHTYDISLQTDHVLVVRVSPRSD